MTEIAEDNTVRVVDERGRPVAVMSRELFDMYRADAEGIRDYLLACFEAKDSA